MRHRFAILLSALLTISTLIGIVTIIAIDRADRESLAALDKIIETRQQREEALRQATWLYAVPMVDLVHKLDLGMLDSVTARFRLQGALKESDLAWQRYSEQVPLVQREQLTQAQDQARDAFVQLNIVLDSNDTKALNDFIKNTLYSTINPFTKLAEAQIRQEITNTDTLIMQTREQIQQQQAQTTWLTIACYTLTILGSAVLVLYLMRRIKAVRVLATAMAHDDLDLPTLRQGSDEIGQIHDNLLSLYARLKTQWDELHTQNATLTTTLTHLERSQAALEANEERWKLAIAASESGIWEHDLLRNRVYFSPSWKAQLGFQPGQLLDDFDSWALRLHPNDAPTVLTAYKQFVEGKQPSYHVEFRLKHRNGSWCWLQSNASAQCDTTGHVVRIVGMQTDITSRKTAEAALITARDEAETALLQLQRTQQQMLQSEKLAALGDLVAGIAHEVNTPLGIAVTAASTLKEETEHLSTLLTAGQMKKSELEEFLTNSRETCTLLLKHTNHAAALIRSFKLISVDQNIDERRPFKPAEYFRDILASLAPKFRHTPHRYTFSCPPELEFDSYPAAFTQIFTNLVTNALLHGFEHTDAGLLTITVETRGKDNAILQFTDNGSGIAADELKRIFEPFFTTKRGCGGSGLGLAIVYNLIVARLGGKINVNSKPGHGTTFTLILPRVAPAQTTEA